MNPTLKDAATTTDTTETEATPAKPKLRLEKNAVRVLSVRTSLQAGRGCSTRTCI
jgi:hypothetical protein